MKKTYLIIYTFLAFSIISCDGFLEERPLDEVASNQYFTRAEHARDAVNALYRRGAMQLYETGVYSGARIMFGPYVSGFVDNDYKGQEFHVQRGQNIVFDGLNLSSYFNSMWSDIYVGISRANNAIKYIPTTPGLSEQDRERYMAEAKFFRAFNYFYLVRMFGAVPLITEPYESLENLFLERTPADQVYALILEDLESAIGSNSLSNTSMPANSGRVTQGIAQTLLAEVNLTMSGAAINIDRYSQAAAAARAVINSGVYSLVQHTRNAQGEIEENQSAYNKIKNSTQIPSEYIYYYEYEIGIANNSYPSLSFPPSIAPLVAYAITNNAYGPTPSLVNSYDKNQDLRIQEKQFFHTSAEIGGETVEFNISPYMWLDEEAVFETAQSSRDLPIFTYSQVLLTGAEAIAKSEGVTAEAVDYLTQVKARAYWKKPSSEIRTQLQNLSVEEFVEEVWRERVRELVFQFPIWFDVMRTRKFPTAQANSTGNIQFVDAVGARTNFGAVIKESTMLFPLPEQELQRNPALTQNPGYSN